MTPPRWQRIEQLYHSALQHAESDRSAYLSEACPNDRELREEVEQLLHYHETSESFLDATALEAAAKDLVSGHVESRVGQTLGRYAIASLVARGGMGEVYHARDTRLDRDVAIKILPPDLAASPAALVRFEREAKAVAALSHPNILAIYDLGTDKGVSYAVTELLEGETLRKYLARGPLGWCRAVEIGLEIAEGLAAAHGKRIIHRDVKPENIFLTSDGRVKILDFGLARVVGLSSVEQGSSTPKSTLTGPGIAIGTVGYMSPEQVRGEPAGAASDVFSVGCVLYEMLTGRRPFKRETTAETLVAILKDNPPPVAADQETPRALERALTRCLAKEPDERFPSGSELAAELRSVLAGADPQEMLRDSADTSVGREKQVMRHAIGQQRLRLKRLAIAAGFIGVAFSVYQWFRPVGRADPFQKFEMSRITTSGNAFRAAISPDGRYAVYALAEGGKQSLWMQQVATSSAVQILPPAQVQYWGLTFSRDGNFIYYVSLDKGLHQDLFSIPAFGGAPKKLADAVHSPVTISPDGKRLAFVHGFSLLTVDTEGKNERKLLELNPPDGLNRPAWSPDGKTVACTAMHFDSAGFNYDVLAVPVAGGDVRPITSKWADGFNVQWLSVGKGLMVNVAERRTDPLQIWHVPYPKGKPRRITNDLSHYLDLSLTADSRILLAIQSDRRSNIWVMPNLRRAAAKQITPPSSKIDSLAWTPDRRVVYQSGATYSAATGATDLWIMQADGSRARQLTTNAGINGWPRVTRDGRYIVFQSDRTGNPQIWRMDLDGGNPKQLTSGTAAELIADCSPDGK